ncbi:MAG: hypothetical protein RL088_2462 [Verrucomicrobiota bacterium]|jgi:anti-sigma factor RsiW
MNNSEPDLTPEEEKLTAYLDGALPAAEAAAFERENPGVAAERVRHERLRDAMAAKVPALKNGDFFNHQILREIAPPQPVRTERRFFPLWRLAFAAAVCVLAAAGVYFGMVERETPRSDYFAQVLSVKAGDEDISAQLVSADGLAVVWIDGLDSLPSDYVLE